MSFRTVFLASDHGGFQLKQELRSQLEKRGTRVVDLGPERPDSCDYPHYARAVCERVLGDTASMGILVCGTGLGMSMTANRMQGIRAAVCTCEYTARMAREHNNANVLCLGERVVGSGLALSIVDAFLATDFQGGRHLRRIGLIDAPTGKATGE